MLIESKARLIRIATLACTLVFIHRGWAQTPEDQVQELAPAAENVTESESDIGSTAAVAGGLDLIDDIWDLLNSVSTRINTAITRATEARDRAIEARDRATQARDHAADMVDNMQDGLQNLTAEMRERIQDAVETLQQAIQQELADAGDFINGRNSCSPECEDFRSDIISLLTNIENISNALLAAEGIEGEVDFSDEISFIDSLSGKALYPLYRVLRDLPVLNQSFLETMNEIEANLSDVAIIITDTAARGPQLDVCELLAGSAELVSTVITAAQNIGKVGKGLKSAGAFVTSIGKTKIAGRAGIWGWAGISYSSGLLERFGGHLESLGNRLSPIADKLEKKLQYCVLRVNTDNLLTKSDAHQQEVMKSQQAILDAIKAIEQPTGADLNNDGTINLADFAIFQTAFGSTSP